MSDGEWGHPANVWLIHEYKPHPGRWTAVHRGKGDVQHHPSPPQSLTSLPISIPIEIGVPLPQQHLGLGVGADLAAAVAALARRWPCRCSSALARRRPVPAAAVPEITGALDAAGNVPYPQVIRFRSPLSAQIGGELAVAEVVRRRLDRRARLRS
jgi:hypothetical protein